MKVSIRFSTISRRSSHRQVRILQQLSNQDNISGNSVKVPNPFSTIFCQTYKLTYKFASSNHCQIITMYIGNSMKIPIPFPTISHQTFRVQIRIFQPQDALICRYLIVCLLYISTYIDSVRYIELLEVANICKFVSLLLYAWLCSMKVTPQDIRIGLALSV